MQRNKQEISKWLKYCDEVSYKQLSTAIIGYFNDPNTPALDASYQAEKEVELAKKNEEMKREGSKPRQGASLEDEIITLLMKSRHVFTHTLFGNANTVARTGSQSASNNLSLQPQPSNDDGCRIG